jgi:exodeoxyribonuclease V
VSGFELSEDQALALKKVVDWYRELPGAMVPEFCESGGKGAGCPSYGHTHGYAHDYPVMSLGGLAGTGKTTLTALIERELKARVAYATPTHKAASVLRRKLEGARVSTYHSMIYYPCAIHYCGISGVDVTQEGGGGLDGEVRWKPCGVSHAGECRVLDRLIFERRDFVAGFVHLIVVDEASMLGEAQVEDIRSFGVPVLLVGDHGQLPPVKAELNRWIKEPIARLEVNHRQGDGSSIVELAHRVRAGVRVGVGMGTKEIGVLSRVDHPEAVAGLLERFKCGEKRIVITWRNRTRVGVNAAMRTASSRVGGVAVGDRVVCLRGAELVPEGRGEPVYVHNGELGEVVEVGSESDRGRKVRLKVKLDGDRPVVSTVAAVAQFGCETALAHNDKLRPSGADWTPWDYGYCITAHKAQGSEFDDVIVIDEGPFDYERWMYTAITRAAKRLVVVRW